MTADHHDHALGTDAQFGATADLAGPRERHLPHDLASRAVAAHPRIGFAKEVIASLPSGR